MHMPPRVWRPALRADLRHGINGMPQPKETTMKNRTTTLGALAGCAAVLLLGAAPMAANAAPAVDRAAAGAIVDVSETAKLTFVAGTLYDAEVNPADDSDMGRYTNGTSSGRGNFTQDDGWDPDTRRWTGGNELVLTSLGTDFTISDLKIRNGKVTGHFVGFGLPEWMLDLSSVGTSATIEGDQIVVTSKDGDYLLMELRFQLSR